MKVFLSLAVVCTVFVFLSETSAGQVGGIGVSLCFKEGTAGKCSKTHDPKTLPSFKCSSGTCAYMTQNGVLITGCSAANPPLTGRLKEYTFHDRDVRTTTKALKDEQGREETANDDVYCLSFKWCDCGGQSPNQPCGTGVSIDETVYWTIEEEFLDTDSPTCVGK